jgi:hypothetical protein
MSWRAAVAIMLAWALPPVMLAACAKEPPTKTTGAPVSATAPAPPAPASAPPAKTATAFGGTYTAKVGAVDLGKSDKAVKWPPNPAAGATGAGTIDLTVADPRGDVSGQAKGPLGSQLVSGVFDGRELRANLIPNDPNADDAMTGVMTLAADGAGMRGTLRVSGRDARIVREASVEMTKK